MLAEALGHGRGATRLEEAIAGLQGYLRPTSVPIRLEYDRTALATKLAAFRALGARAATDARARMLHGTFLAMPAHEGVTVDTTAIESEIDAALASEDKLVAVFAQRDARVDVPTQKELFSIGTVAVIKRMVRSE